MTANTTAVANPPSHPPSNAVLAQAATLAMMERGVYAPLYFASRRT